MTRDGWKTAYAEIMAKTLDIEIGQARDLAEVGAQAEEDCNGSDVSEWETPQAAVDEELSNWGD